MVDDDINILGGPLGNELEELVRLKDEVQRDLQILRDERTMLNKERASLEEYKEHVTRFLDGKFHDLTNGQASATQLRSLDVEPVQTIGNQDNTEEEGRNNKALNRRFSRASSSEKKKIKYRRFDEALSNKNDFVQEKVLHSSQVIDDATFLEEDDIYNVVGAQKEQVESQAVLRKGESNSFW